MNCDEILLLLPEYIEDRLESDEHRVVESHIGGCAACKSELEEIGKFLKASAPETESSLSPPEGYFDTIWPDMQNRIRTEEAAGRLKTNKSVLDFLKDQFAQRPFQLAGLPAVAALLAVLLISYQSEKYQPNEYSIATRMTKMISDGLSEKVIQGYESSDLASSVALNVLPDSSQINLSGILNSEKRVQAYEDFTDLLADFLVKTQNN